MYSLALITAATLIAAPGASAESSDVQKGFLAKSLKLGEKEVKYVVYVPSSYDPAKPTPTIIFLNGMGECGSDGWRQVYWLGGAIMLSPDKWPFIVVFPQKQNTPGLWEDEDDMVMAALEATRRDYSVDASRIYLTGLSQGGHGTWAIAARHPDLFAAIAPICGWGSEEMAKKLTRMPVWAFHGDADTTVQPDRSREMAKWVEEAGGSCKLTIYPGVGHNSWDKAYRDEDLPGWFVQHQRPAKR